MCTFRETARTEVAEAAGWQRVLNRAHHVSKLALISLRVVHQGRGLLVEPKARSPSHVCAPEGGPHAQARLPIRLLSAPALV